MNREKTKKQNISQIKYIITLKKIQTKIDVRAIQKFEIKIIKTRHELKNKKKKT